MKYFRDLWKITTAYLVGSFALIQFANIALPYFEVEAILGLNSDLFMRLLFIGLLWVTHSPCSWVCFK